MFGVSEDGMMLQKAAVIFYYFHFAILMNLPTSTFAAFYVVVCYHLRCLLKRFARTYISDNDGIVDYKKLLRSFSSLHGTIQSIDNKLSIFVPLLTTNVSLTVAFVVSDMLRHSNFYSSCFTCLDRVEKYINMVHAVILFVSVTISASLVHEAYDELRSEARRSLVLSDRVFTNEHLKFMICMEKGACLTVHKIVKIRRSFIVATFGCVVTYMLILDNMLVIA
ncbi:hypothetical protein JTE90_010912 [Oedothorax gibbosus]|uniref:Gustatory receptor n=1 Tax=Oedothorax gibbosus TaxID=931172 RepID=A0AAV6UGC6_9ARAC|nr:hypothetical protein JTE90_010912 [Oedothorax gibbosus]